jgi:3-phosphoshikimate 1-carboxyvinyltransferase
MSNRYVYPDKLEIKPLDGPVNATIRVPGSKSITNRALVLAALASRDIAGVFLSGALKSDDTELMAKALSALGFRIDRDESGSVGHISNPNSAEAIPASSADLFVGNSGTTMRFLTALVSLGFGRYRLDGDKRMRERPIEDLLEALGQLGVNAYSESGNGCPPIIVETVGLRGGHVVIRSDLSSQFLSAVLMVSPYAQRETLIEVKDRLVSEPFVDITLGMMNAFGVGVLRPSQTTYRIPSDQRYWHEWYHIEPDATAASYFFGAAAVTAGRVVVVDLGTRGSSNSRSMKGESVQGDLCFTHQLEAMGCRTIGSLSETVIRGAHLHGITADMNAISDTVPTLAAVACFAEGPTTIRNVAHIRHKECDRISALCTELRKLGVEVEEYPDGLKITPRPMHGAEIETYNDHRIAMSMALIGLRVPGVIIKNPGCVAKTYPGYWEDFEKLYQ